MKSYKYRLKQAFRRLVLIFKKKKKMRKIKQTLLKNEIMKKNPYEKYHTYE